jgi:hypothetical protein
MLILEGLRDTWALAPDLRTRVVAWRWFATASQAALQQAADRQVMAITLDDDRLCRVFFDWVRAVDTHAWLETRDPLDFRHAMAGLLLQQMFAAQRTPHHDADLLRWQKTGDSSDYPGALPGTLFTSFVLTLLQAMRLQMGAPAFELDADLRQYWHSYLENAAQDPSTAICFLDKMTGLTPVWQAPESIDARPAMQAAAATAQVLASL